MKIEVNTDLYKAFSEMVAFMGDVEEVDPETVAGWIEDAIENRLVEFFNHNDDLYKIWNKQYKGIEKDYKKYQDEKFKDPLNK